jgi:hypothetical protein
MRTLFLILCVVAITGCAPPQTRDDSKPIATVNGWEIYRVGPDEHGVACYKMRGIESISCVKVQ